MSFYYLTDDKAVRNRWFLNGPSGPDGRAVDPRIFTYGRPIDTQVPLHIALRRAGQPLDFTLADFDMPVLRDHLGSRLAALAPEEVQLIPATIEGSDDSFVILNAISTVECLDAGRSDIVVWTEADGEPDRVGMPRMVLDLKIDATQAGAAKIFRVEGWKIALIISEEVRAAMAKATGARFQPV